ncbi:MAG: hypothetical protein Fur0022_17400 [Anaerolineales bacterium]
MKQSASLSILFVFSALTLFLLACGLAAPAPLPDAEPTEEPSIASSLPDQNDLAPSDSATPTQTSDETDAPTSTPPEQEAEPIAEVLSPTDEMLAQLPLLEDATDLYKSSETGQTYTTQKSIEEVLQFYFEHLPAEGWLYDEASSVPGEFYIFEQEGFEVMLQVFESSGAHFVVLNLHEIEDAQAIAQDKGMIFPDDAQVETFIADEQTENMRGEFTTALNFENLLAFYSQAFPPEDGWRVIPYPPDETAFAAGARGVFYFQNEFREVSFYLQPTSDGNGLMVSFYNEPVTTYTEAPLPEQVVALAALVGDAKDVEVFSESSSTFVVFFSHKPYDEVVSLYQDNLDDLGWAILSENSFETGTTFIIEKDSLQWSLFVGKNTLISSTNITLRSQ